MTAISDHVRAVATASRDYLRVREGFAVAPTLQGFIRLIKATLELRAAFGSETSRPAEFAFNIYLRLLKFASAVRMMLRKKI